MNRATFDADLTVSDREKILRIDSTSIDGSTGNDRLTAQGGTVTMFPFELVVLTSTNTATGNITIYLPDAGACIGRIYHFRATIANTTTVTIKTAAGATVATLATNGDYCSIMSYGIGWTDLATDGIA